MNNIKLLSLLILVQLFYQVTFCQPIEVERVEISYIPWTVEPQWEYTVEEIRTHKNKTSFFTENNIIIDSLFLLLDEENLTRTNGHDLQVRMIIDCFLNDSLTTTVLVSKPHLATKKYKYKEEDIKPPAVFVEGDVIFGIFLIEINKKQYKSSFEFGRFILKNIPKARIW